MHTTEQTFNHFKEGNKKRRKENSNVGREERKEKKLMRTENSNLNLNFQLSFDSLAVYFICKKEEA